jgi:hypothetical protein
MHPRFARPLNHISSCNVSLTQTLTVYKGGGTITSLVVVLPLFEEEDVCNNRLMCKCLSTRSWTLCCRAVRLAQFTALCRSTNSWLVSGEEDDDEPLGYMVQNVIWYGWKIKSWPKYQRKLWGSRLIVEIRSALLLSSLQETSLASFCCHGVFIVVVCFCCRVKILVWCRWAL